MENQDAYHEARQRVAAKIGFYIHLVVYVCVNIVLIVINFATSSDYLWFKWPLLGWGIGILFHALSVFVFPKGSTITGRMIEKEMKKEPPEDQ
jgi:hypothetical protein